MSYLAELDDTVIGDGDPWRISMLQGVGGGAAEGPTQQLSMAPGELTGTFVPMAGAVGIAAFCRVGSAAVMEQAIADLCDLWVPSDRVRTSPVQLWLTVPGRGVIWVEGFPVQMATTRLLADPESGAADVVLTFKKTHPAERPGAGS